MAREQKKENLAKQAITKFKNLISNEFFSLSPLVRLNILAIIVGIVGGIGSLVFRLAIAFVFHILFTVPQEFLHDAGLSELDWLPFLLAPIFGGLIVGFLTSRVSKETKGHGVPEVLESVALKNGKMNLRVPFIKIIASAMTIGSGGSAGREGPIAQIGSGFASFIGQKLDLSPRELRTLVVSGVAAGISATFNAPIGGTLFAVEVVMRETSISLFVPIIMASVTGTVTGQLLYGDDIAFKFPELEYKDPTLIPFFMIIGLITGVLSALWIKFFYKAEDFIEVMYKKFKIPDITQAAIGGFCIGIILVITYLSIENWEQYTMMGRLYAPMNAVFDNTITSREASVIFGLTVSGFILTICVLILLGILKVFSTIFTIGTGGSGGVFAPTLFIGVMIGGAIGVFTRDVLNIPEVVALFALLGMAAFFAGTGRAPLTAIVMTAEMTGEYLLFIPTMLAVSIAYLVSIRLEEHDIYIRKLLRRGTKIEQQNPDILNTVKVSEAMIPREKLIIIHSQDRLETVISLFRTSHHEGFPVFDGQHFTGVITLGNVEDAISTHDPKEWIVADVLNSRPEQKLVCVDPDATLAHAIALMDRRDVTRIPVVEQSNGNPKLIGWITHHDIVRTYTSKQASIIMDEAESHLLSYVSID